MKLIKSKKLIKIKSIKHGFFNSVGGHSKNIYKSLNCGYGSLDNKTNVKKNLQIVRKKISNKAKNILLLKAQKKSKIIEKNCFNYFNFQNKIEEKFNLIFVDPPYKEEKINIIINTIKEKKILTQNGIFIIHRHKKDKIDITDNLKILDERTYGISKITIGG